MLNYAYEIPMGIYITYMHIYVDVLICEKEYTYVYI